VVEIAAAGQQRHILFARIDQLGIFLAAGGGRPHPQQTVFAVQKIIALAGQVIANQGGQANAKIHIGAFGNIQRYPRRQLFASQFYHRLIGYGFIAHTATTRCTKIPGVTTASGSSSPRPTMSLTWAMVQRAARAMMGPKLRADLL